MAKRGRVRRRAALEWAVASVATALVIGILAWLLVDELGGSDGPPDIIVRVDSSTRGSAGWTVHFTARNAGASAAAGVEIDGSLALPAHAEGARARIDYIPPGGVRGGALLFSADPATGELRVRAVGYALP